MLYAQKKKWQPFVSNMYHIKYTPMKMYNVHFVTTININLVEQGKGYFNWCAKGEVTVV